jgi:hypothetical protein
MERVRRSLLARYSNVYEQEKLARSAKDQGGVKRARAQLLKIVERAKELGLPTVDGDPPRIDGRSPSRTELARDVFSAEPTYRILSGAAHGQASFLHQLGMKVDREQGFATMNLSDVAIAMVTLQPILWIARFSYELRQYKGISTIELEQIYEGIYDKISAGASSRFWRTRAA